MKGEFGGGAPEVGVEVILAEPIDACGGVRNAEAAQGKVSCSVCMHKQYLHAYVQCVYANMSYNIVYAKQCIAYTRIAYTV
jgi:hypothetical protein